MSWFDDVDRWFKRIQKYFEELEREMEEEMERIMRGGGFTEEGGERKVRGGPRYYYYGFEISIGPDGKPRIKEFGNVRPRGEKPIVEEDIEPLTDVIEEEDSIKVIMDMPGVEKDKISVRVSEDGRKVIISARDTDRRYYKEVELPAEVDPTQSKATYRNGVLTVELKKKTTQKRGFDIKVE
ncbi:archaeal heat shock protein Hsp20 [Vulcanisaeta thermophila]|uniref:archaeal heat shock protein Hsp20 n=1 Tax=Vulcanisaeta thermophila TaxID=867917 RepID=UPI000853A7EA|nr:archaeal heat shock protein Hsp20 [Vulcanisaeta thermophila]